MTNSYVPLTHPLSVVEMDVDVALAECLRRCHAAKHDTTLMRSYQADIDRLVISCLDGDIPSDQAVSLIRGIISQIEDICCGVKIQRLRLIPTEQDAVEGRR